MKRVSFLLFFLCFGLPAWAENSAWTGTWVLRELQPGGQLTMKIEETNAGWKMTYKVVGPGAPGASDTTIVTMLDGKDVPVLIDGKASKQTMGISKVDGHHTVNIIKFGGKEIGVSKAELSADGKLIRVETDYPESNPGAPAGKQIQFWDRKERTSSP
ncbi:exported protein of unknown function [Nitrospira japonica]|uniref:Lipocalin-like domain-containing protein n=1 Tax=Nitrospira japonica TaxID=1325564 RepID=A0A1W1I9D1_9BACT|nr:hypothetical protein [Nitrospira japonica]SLM49489.1 exported protein of unknown function [Nitrospira japonica]